MELISWRAHEEKRRGGGGHLNDGDAFTLPPPLLPPPHLYAPRLLPLQFGPNPADRLGKFFVHRSPTALARQSFPTIGKFFVV
jgi:hypothetical protein